NNISITQFSQPVIVLRSIPLASLQRSSLWSKFRNGIERVEMHARMSKATKCPSKYFLAASFSDVQLETHPSRLSRCSEVCRAKVESTLCPRARVSAGRHVEAPCS